MTQPAASTAPEIRLVELTKEFREIRAVDRVSLDIDSGEFFSLLGPSGCGKTTTLRMIGGFEAPTSGRIKFGVTPEINAISTIIVAVTAIVLLVSRRLGAFRGGRQVLISEEST